MITMKTCVCLLAMLAVVSAVQYYDEKFDKINAAEVINNPKLVRHYGNCFLGKGSCSSLARELKDLIKDAMLTTCARCSPKQIELIRTISLAMMSRDPALFRQVLDKFDPTMKLRVPFNNLLRI